jgi:hypothetical protein
MGRGVKKCPKLRDDIYVRPLSAVVKEILYPLHLKTVQGFFLGTLIKW